MVFVLCTYKSRAPTLFALPTSFPPTSHLLLRFPSSHFIPVPSFIVHQRSSQPHATTHHQPQSCCSHRHFFLYLCPFSSSTTNITTMDMVQPPDTPTSRMQEIVEHLEHGRFRVASLRLLALDAVFFSDLSSHENMETLWHAAHLLQCLAQTSYTRSFSKPVDRAVNKLLLHATVGCERLAAQHRARVRDDHVRWLLPAEMKVKEMLEILRCFLSYITLQDAVHPPVKDANLTDARRRLQCLCPRISNLTSWSPGPEPPTNRTRRSRGNPPHGHNLRPRSQPESAPDSMSTSGHFSPAAPETLPSLTPSLSSYFTAASTPSSGPSPSTGGPPTTIPTQLLPTLPQYCIAPPPRAPEVRIYDGMIEEVTQPFEMSWSPVGKFNVGFRPPAPDAPVDEGGDWRKRQLQAYAHLSPVSSPAGGGGNEMWGRQW
ncbi:hypothetical protein QBC39DRAFT_351594 [Podospora conica]|nr:hypothetical protein QBC39DRAFT_351594 [Schizothecium conicum]